VDVHHLGTPQEADLVISGGGFLGYYLVGVDRVLRKLEHYIYIHRYAGTSVGALASVAMVCNLGSRMIDLYDQLQGNPDFFPKIREYFLAVLPDDAYLRCTGRVHIVISRLDTVYGFIPTLRPMVVSCFTDNEDLVDACMASSNVPFFVSPTFFYRYRGNMCLDGCFTRHVPVFDVPINNRARLVVRLHRIPYSWTAAFTPYRNMVVPLIVRGAIDTEMFLLHGDDGTGVLEWDTPPPPLPLPPPICRGFKRRSLVLLSHKMKQSMVMVVVGLALWYHLTRGGGTRMPSLWKRFIRMSHSAGRVRGE